MTTQRIIFLLTIIHFNILGQIKSGSDTGTSITHNVDTRPVTFRVKTQQKFSAEQSKNLSMLQGRWTNSQDSLAPIEIMGQCWAYSDYIDKASIYDILEIILTDTPKSKNKIIRKLLILQNSKNKFEFEILSLTNKELSLISLKSGKQIFYRKTSQTK